MATRSPKERLQKLFHKSEPQHPAKQGDSPRSPKSPPPVSPPSKHVRNSSSRTSLRDMLHSKGRSEPKAGRRSSGSIDPQHIVPPETQTPAQVAAATAMYPNRSSRLPNVAHQTDLSQDLQHLTMADAVGDRPFSEAVADRNIEKRQPRNSETRQPASNRPNSALPSNVKPLISKYDNRSVDVANWNMVQDDKPNGNSEDLPPPLNVQKRGSMDSRPGSIGSPVSPTTSHGSHNLYRKPDVSNLRNSSDAARPISPNVSDGGIRRSLEVGGRDIKRSSMDKPLPPRPSDEYAADLEDDRVVKTEPGARGLVGGQTGELADKAIDLTGIVDLSNTQDTTLHERWAPAVTHETIIRNVHEIREERITREIHNHHVFHRVLPIVDIEVLPARHFVPVEGGYAEISEDEVPGRAGRNAQWLIAETVSKAMPQSKGSIVPTKFTARKFEGTDGDYKEYTAPEGFKRTEQWWVHPPTFYEPNAVASGQTYPFYIGSPNPADDGLRAGLPQGEVIGVSPLLAKQRRAQMEAQPARTGPRFEEAPPVPEHKMFPAHLVDRVRGQSTAAGK